MNEPASCSLDSSDKEQRLKAWQEVSSKAISREAGVNKITTVYPSDPELVARLKGLIAAEATCCSFLTFSLQELDDETIVELVFPESARALIEGAFPSPHRAPSPAI